jgi:hypothetical protein
MCADVVARAGQRISWRACLAVTLQWLEPFARRPRQGLHRQPRRRHRTGSVAARLHPGETIFIFVAIFVDPILPDGRGSYATPRNRFVLTGRESFLSSHDPVRRKTMSVSRNVKELDIAVLPQRGSITSRTSTLRNGLSRPTLGACLWV